MWQLNSIWRKVRRRKWSTWTVTMLCLCLLTFAWMTMQVMSGTLGRPQGKPTPATCHAVIKQMCDRHELNEISGNLCQELCSNRPVPSSYDCIRIAGAGKKVMIFSRNNGDKLVLKTKYLDPSQLGPEHRNQIMNTIDGKSLVAVHEFLKTISYSYFTSHDAYDRFLDHIQLREDNSEASVISGETLVSQEEYITINQLQNTEIVPKLFGTCGNFYAMDYNPTDKSLAMQMSFSWPWTSIGEWSDRRSAAISLLALVDLLDKQNMVMCDVKGDNFGSLENGKAVLIDVDSIFTRKEIGSILEADACKTDYDCSFWDCHGSCIKTSGKCSSELSNTNFHTVCSKIFRHHSSNTFHGILESVPSSRKEIISRHLSTCSSWAVSPSVSREAFQGLRKELVHDLLYGPI